MPVVYRCSRCGFILYVFARVGQTTSGLRTPSEIIYMYGGQCPRCGKPLKKPRLNNVVVDVDVEERIERLIEEAEEQHIPLGSSATYLYEMLRGRRLGEAEA